MNLTPSSIPSNDDNHRRGRGRSLASLVLSLALAAGSAGLIGCTTTETQAPGGLNQHEQRPAEQHAPQQEPHQEQQQPQGQQW